MGGASCPVDAGDIEHGSLQIAFSNDVTYIGGDSDGLRFTLSGGKVYDKGGPNNIFNLKYLYVRALYDRSIAKQWENTSPREPDAQ